MKRQLNGSSASYFIKLYTHRINHMSISTVSQFVFCLTKVEPTFLAVNAVITSHWVDLTYLIIRLKVLFIFYCIHYAVSSLSAICRRYPYLAPRVWSDSSGCVNNIIVESGLVLFWKAKCWDFPVFKKFSSANFTQTAEVRLRHMLKTHLN